MICVSCLAALPWKLQRSRTTGRPPIPSTWKSLSFTRLEETKEEKSRDDFTEWNCSISSLRIFVAVYVSFYLTAYKCSQIAVMFSPRFCPSWKHRVVAIEECDVTLPWNKLSVRRLLDFLWAARLSSTGGNCQREVFFLNDTHKNVSSDNNCVFLLAFAPSRLSPALHHSSRDVSV